MASQTVKFDYDKGRNILFAEDDFDIRTTEDADAFLALYMEKFKEIGQKVWLVTSIDGLTVSAKVSGYYGDKLKSLAEQWYLGMARWGTRPESRMTVRMSSLKAKYEVNIYDTREQAIAAIEAAISGKKQ
jgi:hypothetical protein